MTYDPGSQLDPSRGEQILARTEGVALADPIASRPVARKVERGRGVSLSKPARAMAVGAAGVATGLLIAAILPKRSRNRVIIAPGLSRKRRKLKTKQTTSILVDLHLLNR
jgi:hypothetical protein